MKKINNTSAYKEHCQSLAQDYIEDIELYVSTWPMTLREVQERAL